MIKSLKIDNFQSHSHSELIFSEGINIITGQSNCGKTAILRALGWVVTNRPQGLAFKSTISDKKDTCKVSLMINNQEIVREKNNSINSYKLNKEVFNTIGNDVPSEVTSAINMSELSIQNQFEKHFLVTDSSGEIGRTINKIVKLEDIDTLISSLSSKISSTNKEIELKKQDIDKLNASLEKFKDYDKIEALVDQIIKNDIKIKDLEQKVKILNYISNEGVRVEKLIQNLENSYDDLGEKINELEQAWLTYNTNIEIAKELDKMVAVSVELDNKIGTSESVLNHVLALQGIEENVIKYAVAYEMLKQLNNLKSNWEHYYEVIKKNEKLVEKYENEFKDTLKAVGICPLCERIF